MKNIKIILCIVAVIGIGGITAWILLVNQNRNNANQEVQLSKEKDTTPPVATIDTKDVSLRSELSGTVTIGVDAKDDISVSKVEWYVDDAFYAVSYATPYSLRLDCSKLSRGKHVLIAKVFDAAGNTAKSKSIDFIVAEQRQEADTSSNDSTTAPTTPTRQTTSSAKKKTTTTDTPSDLNNQSSFQNSTPAPTGDTQAPSAPSSLTLNAPNEYATVASWSTSTDNVGVEGYKVFRNGTLLTSTTTTHYTDFTVVPGNTYEYSVVAYDEANNTAESTNEPAITLGSTSIWDDFDTPATFGNDGVPLELGTKFYPKVSGKVTGIRFYKPAGDTGIHTGTLWNTDGTPITSIVFSNETASGWQEATLATPVTVTANTTYVVSYTTPQGRYSGTNDYFELESMENEYLIAPRSSGASGSNGVYSTTGGAFPLSSYDETNYWVDVAFVPNANASGPSPTLKDTSEVYPGYPGSNNTGVIDMRLPRRNRVDPVANMTISNVEIQTVVVAVKQPNVTFDHVKFEYTGGVDGSFTFINIQVGISGTTILDSTIDGKENVPRAVYGTTDVVVRRSNIHSTGNAIEVSNHITATDNYFHNIFTPDGLDWHADGIQIANTSDNLTIVHNTIFLNGNETGAVNLVGRPGMGDVMTNILVENNLMAGGGYTVYVGGDTNINVKVINNKFSTRYHSTIGAFNLYYPLFMNGVEVSGNTIYETGAPANINL